MEGGKNGFRTGVEPFLPDEDRFWFCACLVSIQFESPDNKFHIWSWDFCKHSPYNATPLLISIVHLFCSVLFIIYQVMLGCWVHTAFTLEYQGPFSCEPVPYLTAGCAAAVLVALLLAKICYKRKQNWTKIKSAKLQRQINRHMQYRQP